MEQEIYVFTKEKDPKNKPNWHNPAPKTSAEQYEKTETIKKTKNKTKIRITKKIKAQKKVESAAT